MKGLILDLRDNPGGLVRSVYEIGDELLPEGTMVYTLDKKQNRNDLKCDEKYLDIPLVVLVNENSASASEIFAGAVKDYGIGTIVGTTTYGKGVVQTIQPLTDGSAVKITMQNILRQRAMISTKKESLRMWKQSFPETSQTGQNLHIKKTRSFRQP